VVLTVDSVADDLDAGNPCREALLVLATATTFGKLDPHGTPWCPV